MLIYLIILLSSAQGRVLLHMPDILQVQLKKMYFEFVNKTKNLVVFSFTSIYYTVFLMCNSNVLLKCEIYKHFFSLYNTFSFVL